ncbi:hypothetical protein J2T57_004395 [Natronocella acetinitrilica]|uniref:Tubulin-like protein n=1 Tax=Natronocella acetinitrilica TaxID=414046 RepID=A0AAE3GBF7_9GAMM|nr:hypothetical protein [Natronocella acetinitrilica]MCP1677217.1 hypothetical protein [Natronocella acetinitrilica]
MPSDSGLDLRRGRPTPAIGTTEAKLQQRKLDALTRGVHRIKDTENLAYGIHVIGVGTAGASFLSDFLNAVPGDLLDVDGSRFSGLAVNIGDDDPKKLVASSDKLPSDRIHIESLDLSSSPGGELTETLRMYPEYLRLEYPLKHENPSFSSWLTEAQIEATDHGTMQRSLAKAIYGHAYYGGNRPAHAALKRFAESVEATRAESIVCVVFALGGSVGSAIAVDLARHLSNGRFGRRVLVAGIGIAPCAGDESAHLGAQLFTTLNELDCLCDEVKNRGITQSCGELYKNPFTAGFLVVPQEPFWRRTGDLAATQRRVADELTSLLSLRKGANFWEMLRLLNWVAAPPTQHSAARTPWGAKWIHMLAAFDVNTDKTAQVRLSENIGVLSKYEPEFLEARAWDASDPAAMAWVDSMTKEFHPLAPVNLASGGAEGTAQFILPRLAKTDLDLFRSARDAYDSASTDDRAAAHSLLLEHGLLLCERSDRFDGMAGAAFGGSQHWIMVPWSGIRGDA